MNKTQSIEYIYMCGFLFWKVNLTMITSWLSCVLVALWPFQEIKPPMGIKAKNLDVGDFDNLLAVHFSYTKDETSVALHHKWFFWSKNKKINLLEMTTHHRTTILMDDMICSWKNKRFGVNQWWSRLNSDNSEFIFYFLIKHVGLILIEMVCCRLCPCQCGQFLLHMVCLFF